MKKDAITRKKRLRLKDFGYKGPYRYFITLCAFNKRQLFKDDMLVMRLVDILREKAGHLGFRVRAWCFMPDHLHLLIEGKTPASDMRRFISSYKQHTGFHYKKNAGLPLWQVNFYEHVLRREEDTITTVRYIFGNPVRKGIVDDYSKYKFSGSFEFDINDL